MRIDAYTHFFPKKYFERLVASGVPDIGKRVREVPSISDIDVRRKIIDSFPDYKQIISVALPPIGTWTPADKAEGVARIANDGLEELCRTISRPVRRLHRRGAADRAGRGRPRERARRQGARRLRRADRHQRQRQAARRAGVRAVLRPHGGARDHGVGASDAHREDAGLRRARTSRSTRSGGPSAGPTTPPPSWRAWCSPRRWTSIPDLKLIVHHFGGIVPMLEGRIGPGWDQIGARTSDADYQACSSR